jgi:ribonuclease J
MQLTIHRGSHQIGGSCIEVSSGDTRIILDAGLPLDPEDISTPEVPGLFGNDDPKIDALFLSHAHADHAGLIHASKKRVPVYLTEGTSKMLMAGGIFARQFGVPKFRQRSMLPKIPVTIGSLKITALPVDHSVYDAMAFLVEGDGQRLLYTGDLRFHGRKPGMMTQLIKVSQRAPLDVLVIEGTRLGGRSNETNLSEADLENQIVADLENAPGLVLAMYSPLNVDRFVTYYRAAKKSGRTFVVDPYQAFVLHLIAKQTRVPEPKLDSFLRVLIPDKFRTSGPGRMLAGKSWFKKVEAAAISKAEMLAEPSRHLLLYRPSMKRNIFGLSLPNQLTCLYSYWPGYLEQPDAKGWVSDLKAAEGTLIKRHASGHAHPDDLRSFVEQVQPENLIPVHTTSPETWRKWCMATRFLKDGEVYCI